jgi:DNA repair exonuclease SbcCD nuclease subunit
MSHRFRFLQTGDIHVGKLRGVGEKLSLERAGHTFDVIFETAQKQNCHAVLINGDLFDRKSVTNGERELVSRKLAEAPLPTFVIPGNHDLQKPGRSNLDFLAEITEHTNEIPNLHVAFADAPSCWEAPTGDMPGGLFILGAPVELSENQAWIESWAAGLEDNGQQFIFMGHGTVFSSMRNDTRWRPDAGKDKGISLAKAGLAPQVVWWSYGDIHRRQKLPTLPTSANGWYSGSPIQMDFGEEPNRGALVVAFDWDKQRGWYFKGKRYVRFDIDGGHFAPLITVLKEEEIDSLPENALLKLAKGLVLPTKRHEQVLRTLKVVADYSTPEKAVRAAKDSVDADGEVVALEAFDPLMADLKDVEADVLDGLPHGDDPVIQSEARKVVGRAVDRYQERTFVS